MSKFHNRLYAWFFILPQLIITIIFFIWPACSAILQSFFYSDAFGLHKHFAGFANFLDFFHDLSYGKAVVVTVVIASSVTIMTMSLGSYYS